MRRLAWLALGLAFVVAGLYLAARAPSTYVLERECARFHEERRSRYMVLAYDVARAEKAALGGADVADALARLRLRQDEVLRESKRVQIRGWEVVLVPAGALPPPSHEHAAAGRFDPSDRVDPPALRGGMEAWLAPRTALARLFAR